MKMITPSVLILFLSLSVSAGRQVLPSAKQSPRDTLKVEIHTNSARVHLADEIIVTVLFRSPERDVTIWNAMGWGPSAGLSLEILDSAGRRIKTDFAQMFHPFPPDLAGKNALISIGGQRFAGFDSKLPVDLLFPGPGNYSLRCVYAPPLSRDYFQGNIIWGKEDGAVESAKLAIVVEK